MLLFFISRLFFIKCYVFCYMAYFYLHCLVLLYGSVWIHWSVLVAQHGLAYAALHDTDTSHTTLHNVRLSQSVAIEEVSISSQFTLMLYFVYDRVK